MTGILFTLPVELPKTVNDYANMIADYLELRGHWQGGSYFGWPEGYCGNDYAGMQPPACVFGATMIIDVMAEKPVVQEHFDKLRTHTLRELRRANGDRVTEWSDVTPTDQVIATLRGLGAEAA